MTHVLVFGDSITYGAWDTRGGWVGRLREFYDKTPDDEYDILFYNLGVSGDTTEHLLKRFEEELDCRLEPDEDNIVIIQIGKNDSALMNSKGKKSWVDIGRYEANLKRLYELAAKRTDKVLFVGLGTVQEDGAIYERYTPELTYLNEEFRRYDAALKRVAEETGAHYIPVAKKFGRYNPEEVFNDGVHPNNKGHAILFRIVKNYLVRKKILEKGTLGTRRR